MSLGTMSTVVALLVHLALCHSNSQKDQQFSAFVLSLLKKCYLTFESS
jgi:hypothetical protein